MPETRGVGRPDVILVPPTSLWDSGASPSDPPAPELLVERRGAVES